MRTCPSAHLRYSCLDQGGAFDLRLPFPRPLTCGLVKKKKKKDPLRWLLQVVSRGDREAADILEMETKADGCGAERGEKEVISEMVTHQRRAKRSQGQRREIGADHSSN